MSSPFGPYLGQAVRSRVAIIGDSNASTIAAAAVQAAQRVTTGTPQPVITLDYIAVVPGISLGDLTNLLTRLNDPKLDLDAYDAVVINLGVNDILNVGGNWNAYFAGTFPVGTGMYYRARVKAVLDAIPSNVRVYWIGVPSYQGIPGVNQPLLTFPKVLQIDVAIATFDLAWVNAGPVEGSYPAQARFKYIHADQHLGLVNPRYRDGLHYTDAAGIALYNAVVARIIAEQP